MNTLANCLVVFLAISSIACALSTEGPAPCPAANECKADLQTALSEMNISKVCGTLGAGGSCLTALEKGCPQNSYTSMFNNVQIQLNQDEMKQGCGSDCAIAAEDCLAELNATQNNNASEACQKMESAVNCLKGLNETQCKAGVKDALYNFLRSAKDQDTCETQPTCEDKLGRCKTILFATIAHLNNFGDKDKLCKYTPNVTECYDNALSNKKCRDQFPASTEKTLKRVVQYVKAKCNAPVQYPTKTSMGTSKLCGKIHCFGHSREMGDAQPLEIVTDSPPDCSDRLIKCTKMITESNENIHRFEDKEYICNEFRKGAQCISDLSNDRTCKGLFNGDASKLLKYSVDNLKAVCGDASTVVVSTVVFTLGLAVSAFRNFVF